MGDPIFTRTFGLDSGPRVRLRLARATDRVAVGALLAERGVVASELSVRRLLAYDPLTRRVLAAFAPIDGTETLVGIGAIDLRPDADVDTLVIDERLTAGLGELLVRILRDRAQARPRRAA
jgi:hypothetical protein